MICIIVAIYLSLASCIKKHLLVRTATKRLLGEKSFLKKMNNRWLVNLFPPVMEHENFEALCNIS
jgi:hypothetical protein